MSSSSDERGPVGVLADEFLARCKRGERPTIKEYCDRHPELAGEIRDVFEALLMVEDLRPGADEVSGSAGDSVQVGGKRLQQVGDYRILCEIGRGGMGVVYEAEQQALGRRVALKVLPRTSAGDGSAQIRFQREAKAAARMHHTNIVPVFDVGQDGEHLYYAMQLIHGQGLDLVIADLKRLRARSGAVAVAQKGTADHSIAASLAAGKFERENLAPEGDTDPNATGAYEGSVRSSAVLPGQSDISRATTNRVAYFRSVAQIGVQTASAVSYAHGRGIIHRDIKPGNLILDTTGNVWVTDFGLAKTGDGGVTHTGDILGTVRYMSPERFRGQCDVRADVYALGMTLYELLTLKAAYASGDRLKLIELIRQSEATSPRSVDGRIPRDLETIVMKAIDKDPKRRYQSADELGEDLQRFVNDEPIKARRIGTVERLGRWCRRNPVVAALLALVLLVLLGGVAVSTSFGLEAQKRAGEAEKEGNKAQTEKGIAQAAKEQATQEATRATAAKRASDMKAAQLKFRDAIGHAQAGAVDLGLYGLIEALRLAPDDADAAPFRRVLCTSFAFWSRQLPTLRCFLENIDFPEGSQLRTVGKDGKYLLMWPGEQNLQLREIATGLRIERRWQLGGDESISGFTPDNALVLTRAIKDGKAFLQLRDTVTGKPVGPASPGPDRDCFLPILAWPKGAVAAFVTADGQRLFWDLGGARPYPLSIPKEEQILPLILSRDQKPLAVVFHPAPRFSQGTPRLEFWDVTTGKSVPFPVRLAAGSDERVSLDGRIFATVGVGNGQCRWWDLDTGRLIDRWSPRQGDAWQPSADAQTLLADCLDSRVGLFALDTGLQRGGNLARFGGDRSGGLNGEPIVLGYGRAWNTQALALQATAAANASVRLFAGDGKTLEQTRELFELGVLSPNGKLAFFNRTKTGQDYGRLVDVARRQPIGPAFRSQRDRKLMVFSPDEKLLALAPNNYRLGAPDPVLHIYDTSTGRLRLPPLRIPTYVLGLAFTPDSRTLVVGCVGQTVLLDAQTGQPRGFLQQASTAEQLAVSPDGKALAIGYKGGWPGDGAGFRLWDLTTAKPIGPFHPLGGGWSPQQVTFMDQGRSVLVAVDLATRLHVFDRETGRPSAAALPPGDIITNFRENNIAARSRDAVFAFRSNAGTIEQWDAAAGGAVGEPMVHPCAVWRMQYSPDGRLLATVCADNSVRLWDSATGLPLGPPLLHVAPVQSLCFVPVADAEKSKSEAYHLVTASAAGDIHDWHLPAAFPDNPERLTLWMEAAAGCKLGRTETALLDAATWRERCRRLEERWPEAAAALAKQRGADLSAELAAWHEARAGEAQATGNAFAQLWHLDRLAEQRPDNWRLEARRGTVLADNDDFAAAEAAFALAAKKGAGEALADWHSHGAALASGARRWQLALWYLDQQIAARQGDWRPYADRAEVHGQLGQSAERDADLDRAVARCGEQAEVLRLAESRVRQRQWPKAAESYVKAAGQGPLPLPALHQLALVYLENDDLAAYRNICKGIVQAAAKTAPQPEAANAIAWMCALGPKAVEDFDPAVALAEAAVKAGGDARARHDCLNTLAAVLCRAGRYQEARQRLDECIGAAGKDAYAADWLFLALVHLGLDDPAQARQCLAKVPQPPLRDGEVSWADLETEVLRREVETRLK